MNSISVEYAKLVLQENGYCTENLWSIHDVDSKLIAMGFNANSIPNDTKLLLLGRSLKNEATMEQIWLGIESELDAITLYEYDVYARRCSVTGEGINEGYVIGDDYLSDSVKGNIELGRRIKEVGYNSREESYENNFHFYTEWDVVGEIESGQSDVYLKNGTELVKDGDVWRSGNKIYLIKLNDD